MLDTIKTFGLPAFEILFIAFVLYKAFTLIRDTPAANAARWLGFFLLVLLLARLARLYTIAWLFDKFWIWGIIILLLFFQYDLKRIIEGMNAKSRLFRALIKTETKYITEIVQAVERMTDRKIGAAIAIEREDKLDPLVDSGIQLDAEISRELLLTIFQPNSPLQDGAVVIRNRRIAAAGVLLPLPQNTGTAISLGTRHRSAIGLTEETDAVVVVLSAEKGIVSVVIGGNITQDVDSETLSQILTDLLAPG